jgi:hypothetical protein
MALISVPRLCVMSVLEASSLVSFMQHAAQVSFSPTTEAVLINYTFRKLSLLSLLGYWIRPRQPLVESNDEAAHVSELCVGT